LKLIIILKERRIFVHLKALKDEKLKNEFLITMFYFLHASFVCIFVFCANLTDAAAVIVCV